MFIALLIIAFVGLAGVIGLTTYRLGQLQAEVPHIAKNDVTSPAETLPAAPPPAFVTNTPTVTPVPSPTVGPTATPTLTPTPTPSPTNTPSPTPTPIIVITHVNALGRLETAEFAIRTIIDLKNDPSNIWEQIVGSDQLMLVAEGEVVAGFDLNKVGESDIAVQGTIVKITLPPPEIFHTRIDNERTVVYERQTGLLVNPDPTLESRARLLAEQSLTDWATQRGIHDKAEKYGRIQLENLLRSLGFTNIIIEVKKKEL